MKTVESYLSQITGDRGVKILEFHQKHLSKFDLVPGSGHNHQAWEGGYRTHLTQTLNMAEAICEELKKQRLHPDLIPFESVIAVLYFHDLEKLWRDSADKPDWCKSAEAKLEYFCFGLVVEEITLTFDELIALKYIHGEGDDYSKTERKMNRLGAICHAADVLSARCTFDVKI